MTKHNILVKTSTDSMWYEWILSENWNAKNIILCLDGLSLDWHRGFCNKILNLPLNFTKAYNQLSVFQKALSRVIEISSPLHTAFHMLQSIYTVYNCLFRCTQECLGWKKIKYNKTSDNFRLCVHMLDILYEVAYRMILHNYLIDTELNEMNDMESHLAAIELSIKFQEWIEDKIHTTTDKQWKLICAFLKLASMFKD